MITVAIFSFIVIGIYKVLDVARINYDTNLVSLNLQSQARQGINRMIREIRQASWNSITTGLPDINGNQSIAFETPDTAIDTVRYYVTATNLPLNKTLWQLKREYPAGTVKIITFSISRNDFIPSPPPGLRVTFTQSSGQILSIRIQASEAFRSLGQDRTLTFSLTEQVQVRNP